MSLRKCEKLMAPRTLKRVCVACAADGAAALGAAAGMLFSITRTLLATSSTVLRECVDEPLRTLCLSPRPPVSLGRAGVHRRDRLDPLSGRDVEGVVRSPVAVRKKPRGARS